MFSCYAVCSGVGKWAFVLSLYAGASGVLEWACVDPINSVGSLTGPWESHPPHVLSTNVGSAVHECCSRTATTLEKSSLESIFQQTTSLASLYLQLACIMEVTRQATIPG